MKKILLVTIMALSLNSGYSAYAEESVIEKTEVKVKDAKRYVKKKSHRVQEAVCRKDDGECAHKKAKHRAIEVKDSIKDKASEVKNKID